MSWRSWLGLTESRASGLANPSYETMDALGVQAALGGERVTVDTAMTLAAIRAAVAMTSQAVGGLPLKVYRIMDDDARIEARTHRAWRMLHDKPNPIMTAQAFWTATAAQLLLWENSFLFKVRDLNGEVESLYHLDPCAVKVEIVGDRKRYVIEGTPRRVFSDDEVLHIIGYSTNGYYGESRIGKAKSTLSMALARARFEGEFYEQGGYNALGVEHPGRLGAAGVENLASSINTKHGGPGGRHKKPVLEEGAKFVKLGGSLEEMQFAELSEQTRTEIAVLFNLPPAYLGASTGDSLTYATTESNQIQFVQMAVLPLATTIAKALSLDPGILPWNVMFAEFVVEGLLRADMKTRAEYWEKLIAMEVVDAAYVASRENLPKPPAPKPKPAPLAVLDPQAEQPNDGTRVPVRQLR